MPSIIDKVTRFARSPQGKRAMEQAQRIARDPKTKRRIAEARQRLGRRGRP
jgi:hypothetical protein